MALIFEKPSLRTRVTFEVGMFQLGGSAVYLAAQEIGFGKRESVPDIARNLSRWVDIVTARVFAHATVEALAQHATVPVINGLSDREHPCQAMADFFTLWERGLDLGKTRLAWIGDGNNVCHSVLLAGRAARHADHGGDAPRLRARARRPRRVPPARRQGRADGGGAARPPRGPTSSTPTCGSAWARRRERERRQEAFQRYQVNEALVRFAGPKALVMHCLPAHRGEEITDPVLDGPQSVILDQAENRLHAQKAIILHLLGGD